MRRRERARGARCAARRGAVLLEALVALVILATVGVAASALASQAAAASRQARDTDREARAAGAFLTAVSLWPREDLDRHLGDRAEGAWRLRVDRVAREIYAVELRDSLGARVLLATALYRPEAHASP